MIEISPQKDIQVFHDSDDENDVLTQSKLHKPSSTQQEQICKQSFSKLNLIIIAILLFIIFELFLLMIVREKQQQIQDQSHLYREEDLLDSQKTYLYLKIRNKEVKQMDYYQPLTIDFKTSKQKEEAKLQLKDSSEIRKTLVEMRSGSDEKQLNFAIKLFENPDKMQYLLAEYYYFRQLYAIGKNIDQLPICLVSVAKNIVKNKKLTRIFHSIQQQNYTNYKVVIVDDGSEDSTFSQLSKIIIKNPKVKNRVEIVRNVFPMGQLGSRDMAIRNHCHDNSIIVDVDLDGVLIGRQVFKVVNAVFRETNKWFFYSNEFEKLKNSKYESKKHGQIGQVENLRNTQWNALGLRMYKKSLYMSIPISYFLNIENSYEYNDINSDKFPNYALAELADKHMHILQHFLYYRQRSKDNEECTERKKLLDQQKAKGWIPLKALKSLNQNGEKVKNYVVPKNIEENIEKLQKNYKSCKEEGRNSNLLTK